jgi:TRAP-type C4-dicarboxylate transport system substrate-binding protein
MKTKFSRLLAYLGLLTAAALAAGSVSAQQFTMKLSTTSANDAQVEWLNTFKKGVDARSKGKIKVEVYPSNQLGATPRVIEGVAMGTIEMTLNSSGFYEGLEPRFSVFSASGIFDSMEHGTKVLTDPELRKRLSTFAASKGVEVLTAIMHSPVAVVSRKPIQRLGDFKGQKIRVPGSPLYLETFKQLGSAPISMPLGEVMPALQNGTVDGLMAGTTIFTALKYYDVVKNMTYLPSTYIVSVGIVNSNFMKSLGRELETIVREEAHKADAVVAQWALEDVANAKRLWEQNGGKSYIMSPADQATYLQDVAKTAKSVLASNPRVKADYEAFSQVAQQYRK